MQFTEAQITELRTRYGAIDRIDPEGNAYAGLCAFLDKLNRKDLQSLVDARIKWVSSLALNRLNRAK